MRPQLIPRKHVSNKIIVTQLERAIKLALARSEGLDIHVDHDAQTIFCPVVGHHWEAPLSPRPQPSASPVGGGRQGARRSALAGEFEALCDEAEAELAGPRGVQVDSLSAEGGAPGPRRQGLQGFRARSPRLSGH